MRTEEKWFAALLALLFFTGLSSAEEWRPSKEIHSYIKNGPSARTIIGQEQEHTVKQGDTLLDLARQYHLGYEELLKANPGVDPWVPAAGLKIKSPSVWILPAAPTRGFVLNIPEMRLYYYLSDSTLVTFPLGVGMEGWEIPAGNYSIGEKRVDPVWHVPLSIQKEMEAPRAAVPAGPNNPLGRYWMRLSKTSYGIHGTNNPWAVGRRVTHGCIRLYPEDMAFLFPRVPIKTPVRIIYQLVKVGTRNGGSYFQVYRFGRTGDEELFSQILRQLRDLRIRADLRHIRDLLREAPNGSLIPIPTNWPAGRLYLNPHYRAQRSLRGEP